MNCGEMTFPNANSGGYEDYCSNACRAGGLPGRLEIRVTDHVTGGQKGQKAERFDLLAWPFFEEVARVCAFGAAKYSDWNWFKGYKWSLSIAAMFRHGVRFACGEDRDIESGLHHLAHMAWHCMALFTFAQCHLGTDDRPAVGGPRQ